MEMLIKSEFMTKFPWSQTLRGLIIPRGWNLFLRQSEEQTRGRLHILVIFCDVEDRFGHLQTKQSEASLWASAEEIWIQVHMSPSQATCLEHNALGNMEKPLRAERSSWNKCIPNFQPSNHTLASRVNDLDVLAPLQWTRSSLFCILDLRAWYAGPNGTEYSG